MTGLRAHPSLRPVQLALLVTGKPGVRVHVQHHEVYVRPALLPYKVCA